MIHSTIKNIILKSVLILIFVLIITFVYIRGFSGFDFGQIKTFSIGNLVLLSALSILILLQNAESLKLQIETFGFPFKFSDSFYISQFYGLLGYLPFKLGIIGEASHLKLKHDFPLNKYVLGTGLVYALNTVVFLFVGGYLWVRYDFSSLHGNIDIHYLLLFLALVAVLMILFFFLSAKKVGGEKTMPGYLAAVLENKTALWNSKKLIIYLFLLSIFSLLISSWRIQIISQVFNYRMPFYVSLMLGALSGFSFLISITPGGIGIKESFMGGLTFLIFGDLNIGIIIALVSRIFDLFWLTITGSISYLKIFTANRD